MRPHSTFEALPNAPGPLKHEDPGGLDHDQWQPRDLAPRPRVSRARTRLKGKLKVRESVLIMVRCRYVAGRTHLEIAGQNSTPAQAW